MYNPSNVDLYINADGVETVVGAGKTYYGGTGETEYTSVIPEFLQKGACFEH
ncbi:MAG: hypothetical protein L6V93_17955 [Clostridiales bacterium]|nr:MAG: hypothetical protein L6V93_17955 [Clostridiales bacterium]